MNIKEMHVSVGVEMNKINAALFENILPEEIDFAINTNILRFIKQRYGADSNLKRKGFEMSQKRIDDIRTLVVPNYTNRTYIPNNYDPYVNEKVEFFLPGDYMFAVNSRFSTAENDCGRFDPTSSTQTIRYTSINISGGSLWSEFGIVNGTYSLTFTSDADNYNKTEDLTYMSRVILQRLRDQYNFSEYEFYWERYMDIYNQNCIIVVNKSVTNWQLKTSTSGGYSVLPEVTFTKSYYTNSASVFSSGKLVQEDDILAMQADPFNKTVSDFALYYITNNKLNIFIERNLFVVTNAILSYIRTPRTVSYYLNQDCDLPEHTHPEIISMTVDYLLEAVQAGERYKTHQEIVATNE